MDRAFDAVMFLFAIGLVTTLVAHKNTANIVDAGSKGVATDLHTAMNG